MKRIITLLGLASLAGLFLPEEGWAIGGRGGGGLGGGGARPSIGGGGARPSVGGGARPSFGGSGGARPSVGARPAGGHSPGLGNVPSRKPSVSGGSRPAGNFPSVGGSAGGGLANKLPSGGAGARPGGGATTRPGNLGGGKLPGGKLGGNLGGKLPGGGIGSLPGGRLPGGGATTLPGGGGKLPGGRPSAGDLGNFLNLPKPGPGGATTLPGTVRPGGPIQGVRPDRPIANRPQVPNLRDRLPGDGSGLTKDRVNTIQDRLGQAVNKPGRPTTLPAGGNRWQNAVNGHRGWGDSIRNHYADGHCNNWFNSGWWTNHGGVWGGHWHYHNLGFSSAYWWRWCTWPAFTGYVGYNWGQPYYYDYGSNVVINNDTVYVDQQEVCSREEYVQQAQELADVPPPDPSVDQSQVGWMPLGVFALSSTQDDPQSDIVLQLAVSKEGVISGTVYNGKTDKAFPVIGSVDRETQRVAITGVDKKDLVLETGIYNLTQDQTPVLMHFGTEKTQTWYLVRLPEPEKKSGE